jgi:hypothetical protein
VDQLLVLRHRLAQPALLRLPPLPAHQRACSQQSHVINHGQRVLLLPPICWSPWPATATCQTPGSTGLVSSSRLHYSKTAPQQEPSASRKSVLFTDKDQTCTPSHYLYQTRNSSFVIQQLQISCKNASSARAITVESGGMRMRCTTSQTLYVPSTSNIEKLDC